jgi:hypothetical protein
MTFDKVVLLAPGNPMIRILRFILPLFVAERYRRPKASKFPPSQRGEVAGWAGNCSTVVRQYGFGGCLAHVILRLPWRLN